MYPIMSLLLITVFQAISSEVIEDINLPKMAENKVQCLYDDTEAGCPAGNDMKTYINTPPERRNKYDVDHFLTFLFVDYQDEIQSLLPSQYANPTAFRNLWSAGDHRLFDKVCCGTNIDQYILRTGYTWWEKIAALAKEGDAVIWKSDNCDKEDHCVEQACYSFEPTGVVYTFSYLRNTNLYIDLMIFTAAVYKGITKTFSSRQLTYNLKGGFLKDSSYVTVVYKDTAEDYSIENVKNVYYSLKSNGPLDPIEVCGNTIKLPDPDQDYNCDIRSKESPVCEGEKEFRELRTDASVGANQETFVKLVIGNERFNKALTSYLGGDLLSKIQDIWFSDRNLFVNVFDDRNTETNVKSGYLTFQYGDMKSRGPILYDISPSSCPAIYAKTYKIRSQEDMSITFLDKVNPLFDFTALTLAAARGQLLKSLAPGKTVTLVAKNSDECKIAFDVLSLESTKTKEGVWMMTKYSVSYRFFS